MRRRPARHSEPSSAEDHRGDIYVGARHRYHHGVRLLLQLAAALALFGCAAMRNQPHNGPRIDERRAAYWVWYDQGLWHVRITSDGKTHRYQGTLGAVGPSNSMSELQLDDRVLSEVVALLRGSVQFDFERAAHTGLAARASGEGCVVLDLYLDGTRQPDRVYLGGTALTPARLPIEICPPR
jgi:hypothetical protein